MYYKSKPNPLEVTCFNCHKDITLSAQYISYNKVLCGDCNEEEGGDNEEDQD